jgi:hypothetical protein
MGTITSLSQEGESRMLSPPVPQKRGQEKTKSHQQKKGRKGGKNNSNNQILKYQSRDTGPEYQNISIIG